MKIGLFCLSLLVVLGGCAKPEKAASLKGSYTDLNNDAISSFHIVEQQVTATSTEAPKAEVDDLITKLNTMKGIIPANGFTEDQSAAGAALNFNVVLDPAYQPVNLTSVKVWFLCADNTPLLSIYGHFNLKNQPSQELPQENVRCESYDPDDTQSFSLQDNPAQMNLAAPGPFISPLAGNILLMGNKADAYHIVVSYQTFNDPTLKAWNAWQGALSTVIADLLQIEKGPNSGPVAQLLVTEEQKLQAAYDKLP